ncbi:hypothetical protein MRX96_012851 [Rhipicephalus microplus]
MARTCLDPSMNEIGRWVTVTLMQIFALGSLCGLQGNREFCLAAKYGPECVVQSQPLASTLVIKHELDHITPSGLVRGLAPARTEAATTTHRRAARRRALKQPATVRPRCGDVYYTVYRSSTKREFHYRRTVNVCVKTAAETMLLYNRGTNKFTSLAHCRQSCNRVGSGAAKICFSKPLMTSCARQDVLFSWGFFEDRECVSWNFPSGGCPANDSALFHTAHECRSRCLSGRQRDSQCLPPRVVACDSSRIKYAFFADRSMSDGRMRCLRSSPDVLQYRRCLVGANKFRTCEACMATCKERRFK